MKRLATALFLAAAPVAAQTVPEPLSPFVSDFADILDAETEARITEALVAAREDPGAEIAVVTVGSQDDYGFHVSTRSFATSLFNAWGIGDADRNNGILLLVAIDESEMRLELGDGYPGEWDFAAEEVVHRTILPAFRQDRYAEGIEAGTLAAIDRIARPFAANLPPPERGVFDWLAEWWPLVAFGAAFAGFFGIFGVLVWKTERPSCPSCGRRRTRRVRETLEAATPDHPGRAEETITCRSCDHRSTRSYSVRYRSPASRSSGGSSSGGGASGRW